MFNITINERNHTLEITKKFATAASRFGSDEYRELKEARTDFPTFKVVVKTTKSKSNFNGLTYEFMRQHIMDHADSERLEEFEKLRSYGANYCDIRNWFLSLFPEIAEFNKAA